MSDPSFFSADSTLPVPVLVVEDEPLLQQRLRGVLLQLGYAPDALVFAASLAEARVCLGAQPMALALVDLALPDGNGMALIEQMRLEDPGLGILVVSAWSSEDAILGALRAGATGYVLKERDDLEVMLSIRSVLRGGAPIDPFIARRILQLLPQPAPVSSVAAVDIAPPGRGAERTRVTDFAVGGRWDEQPRDCRAVVFVAPHGGVPHQTHLPQAGRALTHPRRA